MKRELKEQIRLMSIINMEIARPIPMKRELKASSPAISRNGLRIARPIPMKRELKACNLFPFTNCPIIARPIPMKRELKEIITSWGTQGIILYCKAHPDEKGTERRHDQGTEDLKT